ncbi:MAG: cell division protein ZipA C-terminal FtsZ-binding domain-containing protein [Burkholderiales bacterium]
MSKLQIALVAFGILIVAAIYIFNRWQEHRYKKRAESAFQQSHEDVLLKNTQPPPVPVPSVRARERIEPQFQERESSITDGRDPPAAKALQTGETGDAQEPQRIDPRRGGNHAPAVAPAGADKLDYQVDLVSHSPIPPSNLDKALRQVSDLANRIQLWGAANNNWAAVDLHAAPKYTRVRATLQLVNRAGVVPAEDLLTFKRAFERCAAESEATVESAETEPFAEVARELDRFCQDSDIVVGLSVIAQKSGPFPGTKVRAWAEASGFQLRPDGIFQINDEHGRPSITMESHENPGFVPESIRTLTTNGVTLMLDVPKVANGVQAFDKLVSLARQLANAMGGALVDDNKMAVNESGLDQIRGQLKQIYQEMDARGIPAGSAVALRLFS